MVAHLNYTDTFISIGVISLLGVCRLLSRSRFDGVAMAAITFTHLYTNCALVQLTLQNMNFTTKKEKRYLFLDHLQIYAKDTIPSQQLSSLLEKNASDVILFRK